VSFNKSQWCSPPWPRRLSPSLPLVTGSTKHAHDAMGATEETDVLKQPAQLWIRRPPSGVAGRVATMTPMLPEGTDLLNLHLVNIGIQDAVIDRLAQIIQHVLCIRRPMISELSVCVHECHHARV
jgi:hypothetical protein